MTLRPQAFNGAPLEAMMSLIPELRIKACGGFFSGRPVSVRFRTHIFLFVKHQNPGLALLFKRDGLG